jgi:tetratricopeptide (TPR) repeat protein
MVTSQQLAADGAAALAAGDLVGARQALDGAETPHARVLLGVVAYALEDFGAAGDQWEGAFTSFREADDLKGAALAATYLGMLHFDAWGNESVSHGWLSRAGRLLDRAGRCVERGYLELALVACAARDVSALEESAAVALDLAIEFHDPDLEARALADGGLALISQGRLAEGFSRLDEAMAPLSAGEVHNPLIGGTIFCALLTACERTGEMRRAEEWTQACRAFAARQFADSLPVLHAHCRLAYGTVLCEAGRWPEAEAEMLGALGPGSTTSVPKLAEVANALAHLRLLQGRLDDAADLLAPYAERFEVCESLARLHLARGDLDRAAAVVHGALGELVGDRLRAGRLLGLLVEIELQRGDLGAAERSADRLADYADASDSAILAAEAKLSDGRIAVHRGDLDRAVADLTSARDDLAHEERPVLAATIRLELARALAAVDRRDEALAEGRAALACFQRLGVEPQAAAAAEVLRELAP